jgi:hypothetical protein
MKPCTLIHALLATALPITRRFGRAALLSLAIAIRLIDLGTPSVATEEDLSLWCSQPASNWLLALPDAWPDGRVTGLRARGGFEVDIGWEHGEVARAEIRSVLGGTARVRMNGKTETLTLAPNDRRTFA